LPDLPDRHFDALGSRDFHRIADAIATGTGDADASRALILFNTSSATLAGVVVFRVDMPWRLDRDPPPIRIRRLGSRLAVPHNVESISFDPPGADETYGRMQFDLLFAAVSLEPNAWDTYIAEYLQVVDGSHSCLIGPPIDEARYRIVETMRHNGPLPPRGSLLHSNAR
jgi:hypothetical protein